MISDGRGDEVAAIRGPVDFHRSDSSFGGEMRFRRGEEERKGVQETEGVGGVE